MRDALWVNENGAMILVVVDDEGNRVPEPTTTPAPKPHPASDHDKDGKAGGSLKGTQATAHKRKPR